MAKARGETFIDVRPEELRARLSDPVQWARDEWGDQILDVERLDDRSARVALAFEGRNYEHVINRGREEAGRVEYVIAPQSRISFSRRIRYELRESGRGTAVAVTESAEPTRAFKLLSLGFYVPLAAFMARRNLRYELERLGREAGANDSPSRPS